MIAVDTSALMAIALREPGAQACMAALAADEDILISAGTVAETLIVSAGRDVGREMTDLLNGYGFTVVPVTEASAKRIGDAYVRWGKGVNPAGLNFGDCFAYEVAKSHDCPLLFIGNDFPKTDVQGVL